MKMFARHVDSTFGPSGLNHDRPVDPKRPDNSRKLSIQNLSQLGCFGLSLAEARKECNVDKAQKNTQVEQGGAHTMRPHFRIRKTWKS